MSYDPRLRPTATQAKTILLGTYDGNDMELITRRNQGSFREVTNTDVILETTEF